MFQGYYEKRLNVIWTQINYVRMKCIIGYPLYAEWDRLIKLYQSTLNEMFKKYSQ